MHIWKYSIMVLVCGFFGITAARSGEVRYPQTGSPALTLHIPDDWVSMDDGGGHMLTGTADLSAAVALSFVNAPGSLDDYATTHLARDAQVARREDITISGHKGRAYFGTSTSPIGTNVNAELILIGLDGNRIAVCSTFTAVNLAPDKVAIAQAAVASLGLVP